MSRPVGGVPDGGVPDGNKVAPDVSANASKKSSCYEVFGSLFSPKISPEERVEKQPSSIGKYKVVPDPASNPKSISSMKSSTRTRIIRNIINNVGEAIKATMGVSSAPRKTQVSPELRNAKVSPAPEDETDKSDGSFDLEIGDGERP